MKKATVETITISLVLVTLVVLGIGIGLHLYIPNFSINNLLFISIILVLATITGTMFVVIKAAREKRVTVTKDISTRFILREGPVTIEAPDAESAIKMLQVIFNGKSSLKVDSGLTIEVKEPEERDAPETKRDEE